MRLKSEGHNSKENSEESFRFERKQWHCAHAAAAYQDESPRFPTPSILIMTAASRLENAAANAVADYERMDIL